MYQIQQGQGETGPIKAVPISFQNLQFLYYTHVGISQHKQFHRNV